MENSIKNTEVEIVHEDFDINHYDLNEDTVVFNMIPSHEVFYSEESDFGVYNFISEKEIKHTSPIRYGSEWKYLGKMAGQTGKLEYGVKYKVVAEIEYNEKYRSYQYNPVKIIPIKPTSLDDSKIFLTACGVADSYVENLLQKYPDVIDRIIEGSEVDYSDIKGIKKATFERIEQKVKSTYGCIELMLFLSPLGISTSTIMKLFKEGTSASVIKNELKKNPYIITEIKGIGFKKGDDIALKINPEMRSSMFRTKAFVKYFLTEIANKEGHTWINISRFLEECQENIPECKESVFNLLREENSSFLYIDKKEKKVGLRYYYLLERKIAQEIVRLRDSVSENNYSNIDETIKRIEEEQGWTFEDEQIEGIKTALSNNITMIIGKAGVGKTSVTKAITEFHKEDEGKIAQVALSGKAALRIQEVSGYPASTIHRLLEFKGSLGFMRNRETKLYQKYIVIDEASMIGADLFYSLLQAIQDGSKVIIMGDIAQLDSIGVGSVFKDLIQSKIIPIVELKKIHRQAKRSAIITESIKISESKQIISPDFKGSTVFGELEDLILDISDNKEDTADIIIKHFNEEIEKGTSVDDMQIIVPTKEKGCASTYKMNSKIQKIVNPPDDSKGEIKMISKGKSYIIRIGDRVINMSNNYDTKNIEGELCPIFNGNIGVVRKIVPEEYMIIDFYGIGNVVVRSSCWKNIELGYAITVHKYQGSQTKVVIVGVDTSSYILLSKEMLYTAMTRAIDRCYLCGENLAIKIATMKSKLLVKNTNLVNFLQECSNKSLA